MEWKIVPMTLEDTLAAGTVTEEDYLSAKTALAWITSSVFS
jgi:hypothetical protein